MRHTVWMFALLMVPVVQAVPVLDDPAGDVRMEPAGDAPTERWDHADLLHLDVEETIRLLRFTLQTAGTPDASRTLMDEVYFGIHFRYGTYGYELRVDRYAAVEALNVGASAELYQQTAPGSTPRLIDRPPVTGDPESGVFQIDVDRELITDEHDVVPYAGSRLTDLRVISRGYWSFLPGDPATPRDRMPDAGLGDVPFHLGVRQEGHIRLSAEERIRGSNGAATTYFWRINVTNLDPVFDDDVTLSLQGVPETWTARLPLSRATVPANASIHIPVLLTVPFAHQHGVVESFLLEARSVRNATGVGRLQMGVEYLEPAQPAGHHDTVHLHAFPAHRPTSLTVVSVSTGDASGLELGMNTLPEDPRGSMEPVPGRSDTESESAATRTGWVVPLSSRLRLGLDFDLDRTGTLSVPVEAPLGLTETVLEGHLVLVPWKGFSYRPADYDGFPGVKVLADIGPQSVGALTETQTLEAVIAARPEADHVPHDPDRTLAMLLWLHGNGPPTLTSDQTPRIHPGGEMDLPLDEFHDKIEESFSAPDFLQIALNGSTERFLAPGTSLLYDLRIANGGIRSLDLVMEASGQHSDWVEFPAGAYHKVAANDTTGIPVAIRAPPGAESGEVADVVLEAYDASDPRIRGLLRIVATVTDTAGPGDQIPEPDQSLEVDRIEKQNQKTPLGILPIIPALVLSAWLSRRAGPPRRP